MNKLMLLGARNFIDMPKGTFFIPLWENSNKDCYKIIDIFNKNPVELIDFEDLHIYGSNTGSMCFNAEKEDFIFYYDINIVGDASPETTLYLVIKDCYIPETAKYTNDISGQSYINGEWIPFREDGLTLKKEEVLEIRKKFLKENFYNLDNINDEENDFARKWMDKNNCKMFNIYLEKNV